MLKVVVDANVWVTALLNPGKPRKIQERLEQGQFQLFFATELLEELVEVIARPKFIGKIKTERKQRLVQLIRQKANFVKLPSKIPAVSRDPGDDMYFLCAKIAKCDFVVTGDPDLLDVGEYEGVRVVTPHQFLSLLSDTK